MTLISQSAGYLNFYNTVALLTKEYAPADYVGFYANTTDIGPVTSSGLAWVASLNANSSVYQPPGVGSVATTVARELGILVTSVTDYGADPTGLTDSYQAFLAAYNYTVTTGGGNMFVPAGLYRLNSTLVMISSFVNLLGEGPGSIIVNGQTNAPAIQLGNGGARIFKADVRNIGFGQAAGVTAVAGNCGLLANGIGQCRLDNLYVANNPQALYQGVVLNNATQIIYHANQIQNCLNTGVYLKGNCVDFYATDSRSDANTTGWQIEDCQGIYATNCTAFGNASNAWNIETIGPNGNVNHFYTNCIGDTSGSNNWSITQLFKATFASCWGSSQTSILVNTTATGFFLQGANVSDIQFHGGFALKNNSHGVQIFDPGSSAPSNIRFNNFTSGSSAGGAQGNGQAAGGGYGISASSTCTNIRFDGGSLLGATGPVAPGTTTSTIFNNAPVGYINENGGVVSVADGGTINHGLAAQPTRILLSGTNVAANNIITVSNQSSTTITVGIKTAAGASGTTQNVYWYAKI